VKSYENENHYEQSIAYMKGQLVERERIIKILKDYSWAGHLEAGIDTLIADIKGECND